MDACGRKIVLIPTQSGIGVHQGEVLLGPPLLADAPAASRLISTYASTQLFDLGSRMLFLEPATLGRLGWLCRMPRGGTHGTPSELFFDLLQAELTIPELAARLPAHHHDARGYMGHAHRRIRRVYTLATGAVPMERLRAAFSRQLIDGKRRHASILLVRGGLHQNQALSGRCVSYCATMPPPRHSRPSYTTADCPGATVRTGRSYVTRACPASRGTT